MLEFDLNIITVAYLDIVVFISIVILNYEINQ